MYNQDPYYRPARTNYGAIFVFAVILFFGWQFRDTIWGYIMQADKMNPQDVSYVVESQSPPQIQDVNVNVPVQEEARVYPTVEIVPVVPLEQIGGSADLHTEDTAYFVQNSRDVVIFYDDLNGNLQRDQGEDLFNEQLDLFNGYWIPDNTQNSGYVMVWYTGNPYDLYVKDRNGWSYHISEGQSKSEYITNIYESSGIKVFELRMKK